MMVDAGDRATAERLADGPLAGLIIERIGESLLAFPAARLDDVRQALASADLELEQGLDQISGSWSDGHRVASEAQSAWEPAANGGDGPGGRLVSMLRQDPPDRPASGRHPVSAAPARPLTLANGSVEDEPDLPTLDESLGESEIGEDGERAETGEDSSPLDVILDVIRLTLGPCSTRIPASSPRSAGPRYRAAGVGSSTAQRGPAIGMLRGRRIVGAAPIAAASAIGASVLGNGRSYG